MKPPKRIAVDFDGTICDQKFPAIGLPKRGVAQALASFRRLGYKVIIWSCRSCHWDYDVYGGDPSQPVLERQVVKDMVAFLDEHGIPYDEIDDGSKGKPSAEYYIDDKAIHFDENWAAIAIEIMSENLREEIRDASHAARVGPGTNNDKKNGKLLDFVPRVTPAPVDVDPNEPRRA